MSADHDGPIAYLWSYTVKPEYVASFRDAYGPDGEWAAFFRQSDAYRGTDLLESPDGPKEFMTLDYFAAADARTRLVESRGDEYARLDRKWQAATLSETFLGEFRVRAGAHRAQSKVASR